MPLFQRRWFVFTAYLAIAAAVLAVTLFTVHKRQPQEFHTQPNSVRSHVVLSHWLNEGYFYYVGMINSTPDAKSIYRNSTGGHMVSGFIVEKLYSMMFGRYSYRLLALHNQIISAILSALAGLLAYRLARRFELDPRLAFILGAGIVAVIFTFPDNLDLFWEMSAQAYALLFALIYLLLEEWSVDLPSRPRGLLIAQAATIFLMTVMERIVTMGFVAAIAAIAVILRREQSAKRLILTLALPFITAFALHQVQLKIATTLFPNAATTGSKMLWRTGFDGESTYYGDHLDIAKRRDWARGNWKPEQNRPYLFRWPWVFTLGILCTLGVLIAFIRDRAPRIALEVPTALIGSWLLYAAIFSQAVVIHPYLYDVLLFTPLAIALFAIGPSLLESLTRRTGAIVLVIVFSAVWYSFFQMRLYALRWPLPTP